MTREERKIALYCLKASSDYHSEVCEECINYPNCDHMGQDDVTETIIKALAQEPCKDAVSRKDIYFKLTNGAYPNETIEQFIDRLVKELDALPPVTPQSKTGQWVNGEYCSECGCDVPAYIIDWRWQKDMDAKYCPNCGIKMKGRSEEV